MTYLLRQSLRNIILTMGYFCSLIINKFLGKINNLQYNRAMLVDQLYEFQDDIYTRVQ